MNRALVYMTEATLNVEAERMVEDDGIIRLFNNGELVGLFDISVVQAAYITPKKSES